MHTAYIKNILVCCPGSYEVKFEKFHDQIFSFFELKMDAPFFEWKETSNSFE